LGQGNARASEIRCRRTLELVKAEGFTLVFFLGSILVYSAG
jgi:hypothetical protein